ncbi:MAG: hypothetical protein ACO1QB_00745 [Verrucomicrobiales bacterium]
MASGVIIFLESYERCDASPASGGELCPGADGATQGGYLSEVDECAA